MIPNGENKPGKERHRFIFPNFMATMMKNTDIPTQLRSSMLSMVLLLLGMILMAIYALTYLSNGWIFKGLILFNVVAGFIFMSSYLVTTYQQYISYMAAVEVQGIMDAGINTIKVKRKKNRVNQALFFGGILLIIGAGALYYLLETNEYRIYITGGLALIGFLSAISVFFRKPAQQSSQPKPEPPLPLPNKLQVELDEIEQQQELEQAQAEADEMQKKFIQQPEMPDRNKHYPKGKFRGSDGRIYYA